VYSLVHVDETFLGLSNKVIIADWPLNRGKIKVIPIMTSISRKQLVIMTGKCIHSHELMRPFNKYTPYLMTFDIGKTVIGPVASILHICLFFSKNHK